MSKQVHIQLPDGQMKDFPKGITIKEAAGSISSSLQKKAAAGQVNGKLVDLSFKLEEDAELSIVTLDSLEGLQVLRHTSAHVLAQAVKRLYGDVSLGIGPVIEDGFYYDMKLDRSLTSGDLEAIEKEMKSIINENLELKRMEISYQEAEELFAKKGEPFKLEMLKDIPRGEVITLYQQGEFVDLCRGPHLPSTGMIKAFKLIRVSGAYWRGDSENEVLQRVYGVAFQKKKISMHICICWKKRQNETTASWVNSWNCLCFLRKRRGCRFICRKGRLSEMSWNVSRVSCKPMPAMMRCVRHL